MATRSRSRRALVTGASSGIGAATVRLLISRGWSVVAVARREELLQKLKDETGCEILKADITSDEDVESIREFVENTGGLSALVNNAGNAIGVEWVDKADPENWRAMFELNVLGTQRVIKALLPMLRLASAKDGVADIVTVTSTAAFISYEGGGGYNASKSALHSVLGTLRLELSGEPIRVVEVAPGMVKTDEFTLKRLGGDAQKTAALYEGVEAPLVAEDVADVIAYALDAAPHVNLDLIQLKPVAQAMQYKLHRGPLKPKL